MAVLYLDDIVVDVLREVVVGRAEGRHPSPSPVGSVSGASRGAGQSASTHIGQAPAQSVTDQIPLDGKVVP